MTSFEALAVAALRRWCADTTAVKNGSVTLLAREGYAPRQSRTCDARIVRRVAFEQAFDTLAEGEQLALLLAYRDGMRASALARALRCCVPVAQARLAHARLSLANVLDRRDLL